MTDTRSGHTALALAFVLVVAAMASFRLQPVAAAPKSPFQKGLTYLVAWDCLPDWAKPDDQSPCYMEPLIVREVRDDGLIEVSDWRDVQQLGPDAPSWTANPVARAVSWRPWKSPQERAAE